MCIWFNKCQSSSPDPNQPLLNSFNLTTVEYEKKYICTRWIWIAIVFWVRHQVVFHKVQWTWPDCQQTIYNKYSHVNVYGVLGQHKQQISKCGCFFKFYMWLSYQTTALISPNFLHKYKEFKRRTTNFAGYFDLNKLND